MKTELICNDIHSKLNQTRVVEIYKPRDEIEVIATIKKAVAEGLPVSICGARHAMGGQQFGTNTILLDLSLLDDLNPVDHKTGQVEVGAGIMWFELIEGLNAQQEGRDIVWSIRQKQTGADDITIGGSLAANAHGRGLQMRPLIDDVEAFTLIDAEGRRHRCSRNENEELFRLAIGGYGCFGVITSVLLRLEPRQKLERLVEITTSDLVISKLEKQIEDGCLYGDFQFAIDEESSDFLYRGVLSCYVPVDCDKPIDRQSSDLDKDDWEELISLAHNDRAKVFQVYSEFYLSTHKSLYWSDTHQLSVYLKDYHTKLDHDCGAKVPASEMISELYVPREHLTAFLKAAADYLRTSGVPLIYGTVRLIKEDKESFLAWATQDFACVIFNLHTEHDEKGIARSADAFRVLIDLALSRGGSYFLTYHRWATSEQVKRAYPMFTEFLAKKEKYDPDQLFQSDWWRHQKKLLSET